MNNLLTFVIIIICNAIFSQTQKIMVQPNIKLPNDTIISNKLIKSLNGFLELKDKTNSENSFVLNQDLLEMSILVDEMKEIEKSGKYKDNNFYKCNLNNVVKLESENYLIQISYVGVNENIPILCASFEFLANQKGDQFYFSSPLKRNTSNWKFKKIGNINFHYKNKLNEKSAKEYVNYVTTFDEKIKSKSKNIDWYGFKDMPEMLKNIGLNYKLEYNSRVLSTFSSKENNSLLIADGNDNENFNSFDPHDLWHDRLRNVLAKKDTNKPVDEGCAYLYGGSWGISWKQILKTFKEKVSSNKKTDWLNTYEDFYDFGNNPQKDLIVAYVINALIIQSIEKKKGFNPVLELLACGKYGKGNENYFKILEKISGINKSNFNVKVWELINNN
jgi:hypothetical protein